MNPQHRFNTHDTTTPEPVPYIRWLLVLLVLTGLVFSGCRRESADQVQSTSPEVSTIDPKAATNPQKVSKLYPPDTCLKLSEILYEAYLYQLDKTETEPMVRQSIGACEKILEKNPNSLEAKINLLGSKYQLKRYYKTREQIRAEKLEETVREGVATGLEEARLLMGMLVGGGYFNDRLTEFEILLPLLKSNNPKRLAATGVVFKGKPAKTGEYAPIDTDYAKKYLPEEIISLIDHFHSLVSRGIIVKGSDLYNKSKKNFNYQAALMAFEKAYAIDRDILAGYKLADLYFDPASTIKKDYGKALELLIDVTQRGSPRGFFELAFIYSVITELGDEIDGFEKDQKKSIDYFEKALQNGRHTAKYPLVRIYLDKDFGHYNEKRGVKLFCDIPESERPETTVFSQAPIHVNCKTGRLEE